MQLYSQARNICWDVWIWIFFLIYSYQLWPGLEWNFWILMPDFLESSFSPTPPLSIHGNLRAREIGALVPNHTARDSACTGIWASESALCSQADAVKENSLLKKRLNIDTLPFSFQGSHRKIYLRGKIILLFRNTLECSFFLFFSFFLIKDTILQKLSQLCKTTQ